MRNLALDLARIFGPTSVEGPGERVALWVRGCSLRCRGCFNPHLWRSSNERLSLDLVLDEILSLQSRTPEIEGITLLGGEPFEQAIPLAALAKELHRQDLSVVTFTGYTLEALTTQTGVGLPGARELLDETDLLVDGPFLQTHLDTVRPWLGSTNQNFHFLSDRYGWADVQSNDAMEITVGKDGSILINGWDRPEGLEPLISTVRLMGKLSND